MVCGLLGGKLGHSYSPQIHSQLGEYEYRLFEKKPEELAQFLKEGDFAGLNVTIPYKKDVIAYCDALSPIAKRLGAVNTIVKRADGTLIGHNTDYFGFASMVKRSALDPKGKKVLVLGSGGASNTAKAVMAELGAKVVVISRSGENNYENLHLHSDCAIIVNTTPVGMYPNVGVSPIRLEQFPALEGVLDVIYNPANTQLLLDAQKLGLKTENGLWMLVAQAKESSEWFTGRSISNDKISDIHRKLRRQTENIILIGMPGCGKTTVGKALAQKLGKTFVDADEAIAQTAGCDIPTIFATQGESGFRQLETQALADIGKRSGLVMSTGGGCVTQERNYPLLHQNGTLIWLQRSCDALATGGRPLSQKQNLADMYAVRKPMYEAFADGIVENSGSIEHAVSLCLELWEDLV
ncbi:MAG: AAA family ATPase [Oscillospiraceae bacterium]|nr:AAA family ATPase [Oscillospiraceae bacterium]